MSLYKDASLVMIPSAYKDGKLYSIRPVEELGDEEVTNGTFDTDSDWTKAGNVSIANGVATYDDDGSNTNSYVEQNVLAASKTYRIVVEVTRYVAGRLEIVTGSNSYDLDISQGVGRYQIDANSGSGTILRFKRDGSYPNFDFDIDNVSAKEVLTESGDFTFSRGSNLAATRVDVNGLIEKGRENLLLQSNSFNNWTNYLTTETSGQADKDGGTDAWLLEKTGASGSIYRTHSVSGVNTFSTYIKAGTLNWVRLDFTGGGSKGYFDLQNGVVGSVVGSPIHTAIESVGGGWYRCSVTTTSVGSGVGIIPAEGNGSISGTSGNIYIQDAQLEAGLVATDYIETGASTAQAGILEDMPRLDYSGGASCPALLLEPQRTNNIPNSEYFGSGSGWSYLNNVSAGNFVLSPEGKMNATELVFDGSANGRIERVISGLTSGADYSVSLYARVASGTQNVFFGSYESEVFTLTTEWQRLERTQPENDTNAYPRIACDDAATIEIWGFQHEAGSYPTSYIPTYGSSVTRNNDDMDTTFSSALATNGGVSVLFDIKGTDKKSGSAANGRYLNFATNSTLTTPFIAYNRTADEHRIRVYDGSSSTYSSTGVDIEDDVKVLIIAEGDTHKVFANGALQFTRTTESIDWSSITDFVQTSDDTIGVIDVKQLVLFPTQLTDAEAIALTTL